LSIDICTLCIFTIPSASKVYVFLYLIYTPAQQYTKPLLLLLLLMRMLLLMRHIVLTLGLSSASCFSCFIFLCLEPLTPYNGTGTTVRQPLPLSLNFLSLLIIDLTSKTSTFF
jgi:hypothetical protein